jgi:DNA-binding response OmpR family regulator
MSLPTTRPVVLVSEDHADTREMLRMFLGLNGFDVVECAQAGEVLATIDRVRPAVVVLNGAQRGLDGPAFARQIRNRGSRPGLVFLSTQGGPAYAASARAAGSDAFLLKPVELADLLTLVRRLAAGATEMKETWQ